MAQIKRWFFKEKYQDLLVELQSIKHQLKIQEQLQNQLQNRISDLEHYDQ